MSHKNNGKCELCSDIFCRYPNFYPPLRAWFEEFQLDHPEFHISEAGRGREKQTEMYESRPQRSRAIFGESAHNWNAAIDLFINLKLNNKRLNIYDEDHFRRYLVPRLADWLNWYGREDAIFREIPHVEVRNWKLLANKKLLKLVEDANVRLA